MKKVKQLQTNIYMRNIIFYILVICNFVVFNGCNKEDDIMNTQLIRGAWEVVSQDSPQFGHIYNFTTKSINTDSWGIMTSYTFSETGELVADKVYEWHVSDPKNYDTVQMDIFWLGYEELDDAWKYEDHYVVEKLSPTEMILRKLGDENSGILLKLKRRNDLTLPKFDNKRELSDS